MQKIPNVCLLEQEWQKSVACQLQQRITENLNGRPLHESLNILRKVHNAQGGVGFTINLFDALSGVDVKRPNVAMDPKGIARDDVYAFVGAYFQKYIRDLIAVHQKKELNLLAHHRQEKIIDVEIYRSRGELEISFHKGAHLEGNGKMFGLLYEQLLELWLLQQHNLSLFSFGYSSLSYTWLEKQFIDKLVKLLKPNIEILEMGTRGSVLLKGHLPTIQYIEQLIRTAIYLKRNSGTDVDAVFSNLTFTSTIKAIDLEGVFVLALENMIKDTIKVVIDIYPQFLHEVKMK